MATLSTIGPSLESVCNVADIRRRCPFPVGKVRLVYRARIVKPQRPIDGRCRVRIIELLEIAFEVFGTRCHHSRNLILRQVMLAWKSRALLGLHQPPSIMMILILRCTDTDVPTALLHDDAQDNALLDADFGSIVDGVEDAADVLAAVACLLHRGFVNVEEGNEILPGVFAGEGGGGAGVGLKRHFGRLLDG